MRRAGRIVADTISTVLEAVEARGDDRRPRPGGRTRTSARRAATPSFLGYRGTYPATICASIDDEIVHGIPSPARAAEEGAAALARLRRDLGRLPRRFGRHGLRRRRPARRGRRAARRRPPRRRSMPAIAVARPGGRLSDIGARDRVGRASPRVSVSCASTGATASAGRCTRTRSSRTSARPGRGPELRPGLVIAIEPMLMLGGEETRVLADGWTVVTADGSLAAHFEHTVAMTEDGPEVLTARVAEARLRRTA